MTDDLQPPDPADANLILVRHGQSTWNLENRFTGWVDVDLSPAGAAEAHEAGAQIRAAGIQPDRAWTSLLKRAVHTLWIMLDELDAAWLPVHRSWRLNERHYGALQGLDKAEMAARHGEEQVHIWRRSYATPPPPLDDDDPLHPRRERRYAEAARLGLAPAAESLRDTLERVLPCWEGEIAPALRRGERVLVAAHGNSLRAIAKHIEDISDEDIPGLNIPTGMPLAYSLDSELRPIGKGYLAGEDAAAKAAARIAAQAQGAD